MESRESRIRQALRKSNSFWLGVAFVVAIIIVAAAAPLISPFDPTEMHILDKLAAPGEGGYLLGSDQYGRDILSRLLHGAKYSLGIGFASVGIAMVIGVAIGVFSGYRGGMVDNVVSEAVNITMAFPVILLAIMLVAVLGTGFSKLVAAIAFTLTPRFIRLARGPTISLKEESYVEAARSFGKGELAIMRTHIFPNMISEIGVMAVLWTSTAIQAEAGLSFLGLGIQPPAPSWGGILRTGVDLILTSPWMSAFAGIPIFITVLSLNLMGDALRDILDPKMTH